MKKPRISLEALAPFFEKIEKLPKLQRVLIFGGVFAVLVGSIVYFLYMPKISKIETLKKEQSELEGKLAVAKKNSMKLPGLREKRTKAEARYRSVMKALPENEEIPSLLTSISQSGTDSGLEFLLFQPRGEIRKDFYSEIPVSIRVEGGYHNVAMFFDRVAGLSRIVNIRNIVLAPKGADSLTASCTAVTYKFVEPKKKKKKKKRGRRKK